MTKNLKLSFILLFTLSAIIIAWRNLTSILNGTGLIFVGLLTIVMVLLSINLTDNACFGRTKDLFFSSCVLVCLEVIIYIAFDFPVDISLNAIKAFLITQNVFSVIAILFFAYTTFRFIYELKGLRFGFIEFILGNKSSTKKIKKSKEIFNGSLEDKPIHQAEEAQPTTIEEEQPVEIETQTEPETQSESETTFEE